VFVNSKVFFFPKQGENYLQLKTSLTLNQAFVACLCQQFLLVFLYFNRFKDNKKAPMIIITTGELNCCGGGWLSRGFRFWWQIFKMI
jgi:hypothetical protein